MDPATADMNRILIIRGGAIGDFVLTLPAIKLLRDRFPQARIEILGSTHITALAEKRFYADAVCSIESRKLAPFFAKNATLPAEVTKYFGSFDLIVSYLFDPDLIFQDNLHRCGTKAFISGPPKLSGHEHAAHQVARPLEQIGLHLKNPAARIYPTDEDREFARNVLGNSRKPFIALHPGSGSETKNWPVEKWEQLGEHLFSTDCAVFVIGGEADEERLALLATAWKGKPVRFVKNLPLPRLAALLEDSIFIGHDSGVSHIAAAVGARCILLFGPTDPAVWAPASENVLVLRTAGGDLRLLDVETVAAALGGGVALREEITDSRFAQRSGYKPTS
ncbi:MAG: heptosyltransferase [Verrucomicrobiota bacterium]|jgi:heptosyltransferase-2